MLLSCELAVAEKRGLVLPWGAGLQWSGATS